MGPKIGVSTFIGMRRGRGTIAVDDDDALAGDADAARGGVGLGEDEGPEVQPWGAEERGGGHRKTLRKNKEFSTPRRKMMT